MKCVMMITEKEFLKEEVYSKEQKYVINKVNA